nr:hypothetical protein [uncultured Pseudacidovorax sp.]
MRCTAGCGVAEFDHELVARPACGQVALSQLRRHDAGHGLQHTVAHLVGEPVVDRPELVDVEQRHGEGLPGRWMQAKLVAQNVLEMPPISDALQCVLHRPALELAGGRQRLLQVPLAPACNFTCF